MEDHPDADEIRQRLDRTADWINTVYEVGFTITAYDAHILIENYWQAEKGDLRAIALVMSELEKLVYELLDMLILDSHNASNLDLFDDPDEQEDEDDW